MTNKIQYKVDNTIKYGLQAFDNKNLEDALNNARKAIESICKAIILDKRGDNEGQKIILGEINGYSFIINSPAQFNLKLADLIKLCKHHKYFSNDGNLNDKWFHKFEDVRYGGNKASHDPNDVKDEVTFDDVEYCLVVLKEILKWFWNKFLTQPIPQIIQDAFEGKIDKTFLLKYEDTTWEELYDNCDCFSMSHKYILITPPDTTGLTENQLAVFARVGWNFIFDFNSASKDNGLYKALQSDLHNQQIHPITIEQKDQKELLVSNSGFALNWFFAKGINSIQKTISTNERQWRNLKYADFTIRLIKEYINQKVQNITLLFLWDDIPYIKTIIQGFDDNVTNQKMIKYVIAYQNEENKSRLENEFNSYDALLFNISIPKIIEGIRKTIVPKNIISKKQTFQIPARGDAEKETFIDLGSKYLSFYERSIEVLYQGIENTNEVQNREENSFYKGNIITWRELATELDVRRNKKDNLLEKIKLWLEKPKGGYPIELIHKPGAGGTTLARRIAFEFHGKYPTIIIFKYHKEKTNQAIFELADLAQKPILAILEGSQVTQNNLNELVRKTNEDKKHVVFLYVERGYKDSKKERNIFLDDKTADTIERDRFVERYSNIGNGHSKDAVKSLSSKNPSQCEIIDFALTAYEQDFSSAKVEDYLQTYLSKLPGNQLKFSGFATLLYHYTQKNTSEYWFSNLFENGSLSEELMKKNQDERFIQKLFIQEFDTTIYEETEFWRPRFSRFGMEILKLTLVGLAKDKKENWKDYLSGWAIDFIKECKRSNQYLTEDLKDLFKSLFLNRDNEDVLGTDESYYENADRQFAKIIRDIAHKEGQLPIFKCLVDSYPDEPHFRAHLGRFLYKKATTANDYEEAIDEIVKAIDLGETDFILWHIKGMCNSERIAFFMRSDLNQYEETEIDELENIIQELANVANEDFQKSRELNQYNLHSHTAQIQMLIKVISFGKDLSKQTPENFISDKNNKWYEKQLNEIFYLLDEAGYIIELSKDLEQSKIINKSKNIVDGCEGQVFNIIGKFSNAVDKFKRLSETAERDMRPYFRKMFVYSTLASKVGYDYKNFKNAWQKLSEHEYDSLRKALENNISEEPQNPNHIKLWLQAVRNHKTYISIEECIRVVKQWFDNSNEHNISHLEATYYMYVFHACKAINEGDNFDKENVEKAKGYLRECSEKSTNDRYSFEWFGNGSGIKMLVNHSSLGKMSSEKGFFEDVSLLKEIEGTISKINDRQKGKIVTKCGLEAFFVPSHGGFEQAKDITTKVKFYIGFRQTGLVAWKVKRVEDITSVRINKVDEIEGFDSEEEVEEMEMVLESAKVSQPIEEKKETDFVESPVIKGLTVVGKIDLSQFDKFKKKKRL